MGQVPDNTVDHYIAFLERAHDWFLTHGIVLGEGRIRYIIFPEDNNYQLRAPLLEGPRHFIESVER